MTDATRLESIKFEGLLLSLAPQDLKNVPVYVGLVSELGNEDLIPACAAGITGPAQDLVLRPWLESQGRYRGRGHSMIIADTRFRERDPGDVEIVDAQVLNTALHELGHCFDRGLPPTGECDPVETAAEIKAYRDAIKQNREDEIHVPWLGHGPSWIRIVGHLAWRANQAGFDLTSLSLAAHPDSYGLSYGWQYAKTLREECAAFENRSLLELRHCPPPPDFVELWRGDLVRWVNSAENEEQKTQRRAMFWNDV